VAVELHRQSASQLAKLLCLAALILARSASAATDFRFVDVSGARGIGSYSAPGGDTAGVVAADFDYDGGSAALFLPGLLLASALVSWPPANARRRSRYPPGRITSST
jgi:hypothetical protein